MDVYCPKCGEPWDVDSIHDRAEEQGVSFTFTNREFQTHGCLALGGGKCEPNGSFRAAAAAALGDLLGDDVDGIACEMEDAEMLGLFD